MDKIELEEWLEENFPHARVSKDRKGQLIIYTGVIEDADGNLVSQDEYEDYHSIDDDDLDVDDLDTVPFTEDDDDDV